MGTTESPGSGVAVEVDGDRAVLRMDRDLDLSCVAVAHEAADTILASGASTVCIDLSGAQFVDSSGVAVLLRLHAGTQERGGRTVVVAAAPAVLRVLGLLGLDDELTVVPSRGDAGLRDD